MVIFWLNVMVVGCFVFGGMVVYGLVVVVVEDLFV